MASDTNAKGMVVVTLVISLLLSGCVSLDPSTAEGQEPHIGLGLDMTRNPEEPAPFAEPEMERAFWKKWLNETVGPQLGCAGLAAYPPPDHRVLSHYIRLKGACTIFSPEETGLGSLSMAEKRQRLAASIGEANASMASAQAKLAQSPTPGNATGWALHSQLVQELFLNTEMLERSVDTAARGNDASSYAVLTASANATTVALQADFVSVILDIMPSGDQVCAPPTLSQQGVPRPKMTQAVVDELSQQGLDYPWGATLHSIAQRIDAWSAHEAGTNNWTYTMVNDEWRNVITHGLEFLDDRRVPTIEEVHYLLALYRSDGRDEIKEDIFAANFSTDDPGVWLLGPDRGILLQAFNKWQWPYDEVSCVQP